MLAKRWMRWRGSCAAWLLIWALAPLAAAHAQALSNAPAMQPATAVRSSQPLRAFSPDYGPAIETRDEGQPDAKDDQPAASHWNVLARSGEDRAIEYRQFGQGARHVLVVGPLDGETTTGVRLIELVAEHLDRFPRRLNNVTVTLVRDPNPDGRFRRAAGNARGVLIDQNFATRAWRKNPSGGRWLSGRTPDSEPETRALIDLLADVRPDRVIIVGASRRLPELMFLGPAEAVGRRIEREARLPLRKLDPTVDFGSLAAFTGERGVGTVLLRVPEGIAESTGWETYKRTLLTGMTFEPTDADGHPAAHVAAKPSQLSEGGPKSGGQLAQVAHRPPEKRGNLGSGIRENSDTNPRPDFSRSQLPGGAKSGLTSATAKKPAEPATAARDDRPGRSPASPRASRVLSAAELRLGGTVVPVPPVHRARAARHSNESNVQLAAPSPSPPRPLPGAPGRGERTNALGGSPGWRGVAPRPLTFSRPFANRQPTAAAAPLSAPTSVPRIAVDRRKPAFVDDSDTDNTVQRLPPVDPRERISEREPTSPDPIPFYPDTGY